MPSVFILLFLSLRGIMGSCSIVTRPVTKWRQLPRPARSPYTLKEAQETAKR
jgi:hypothetical protein